MTSEGNAAVRIQKIVLWLEGSTEALYTRTYRESDGGVALTPCLREGTSVSAATFEHGYGTQWKRDGSLSYRGDWSRGKMTGRGYRLHDDGTVIKGYFLDGKAHGFVTIERSNRKVLYEGEVEHD